MKASEVITADLRNTLDDAGGVTYSDDVLLGYLQAGIEKIRVEHPESRHTTTGAMVMIRQESFGTNLEAEFHMDQMYRLPLMHYVAYRAFSSEAADSGDEEQAKLHLSVFNDFFA